MVQSTNMQQVLSMTNVAERVQQTQQARGDDAVRQFVASLETEVDQKRIETHQIEQTENAAIRQEQQRRRMMLRKDQPEHEQKEEEEEKALLDEMAEKTDHGKNINVVI